MCDLKRMRPPVQCNCLVDGSVWRGARYYEISCCRHRRAIVELKHAVSFDFAADRLQCAGRHMWNAPSKTIETPQLRATLIRHRELRESRAD